MYPAIQIVSGLGWVRTPAASAVSSNFSALENPVFAIAFKKVLAELQKEGIQTELVQLAPLKIGECTACFACDASKDRRGSVDDDCNACIEKMLAADGILLGSPTYFAGPSSKLKALIDRAGLVACLNNQMLARKVGAPVVVASYFWSG